MTECVKLTYKKLNSVLISAFYESCKGDLMLILSFNVEESFLVGLIIFLVILSASSHSRWWVTAVPSSVISPACWFFLDDLNKKKVKHI